MGIVKRKHAEAVNQDERGRTRDISGLLASLNAPDPVVRRWSARDLVNCAEASAAMVEQLGRETDVSVREALLLSLTGIGDEIAIQGLVNCLRSEDAALRNEALEALKSLPDAVAGMMTTLLNDADSDVRILAVNILESLRHADVEKWLIKVINDDPHINVCATAVDLLGEVGSDFALEPLQNLKKRFPDEPYIEFAADLAIKRIREG